MDKASGLVGEELPGLVGEVVENYFCKLPDVDTGLALGGALDVVMQCVADRCRVRAPSLSPENRGVEVWEPVDLWVGLIGSRPHMQAVMTGANNLLEAVDRDLASGMLGWSPPLLGLTDDRLLVLANGLVTGSGWPQAVPPSQLIERLLAIVDRPRFIVRMNSFAWDYGWQNVSQWAKQFAEAGDLSPLTSRIRRWVNVAALLAVGVSPDQPVITADILVAARKIAVVLHDLVRSTVERSFDDDERIVN